LLLRRPRLLCCRGRVGQPGREGVNLGAGLPCISKPHLPDFHHARPSALQRAVDARMDHGHARAKVLPNRAKNEGHIGPDDRQRLKHHAQGIAQQAHWPASALYVAEGHRHIAQRIGCALQFHRHLAAHAGNAVNFSQQQGGAVHGLGERLAYRDHAVFYLTGQHLGL